MPYLGKFIEIVTSPDEIDLEAFHSALDKVITPDGECTPADADDLEAIKKQFSDETASLVAVHASNLRWLSQILINQCITHFDTKHQQMLAAFLERLLNTESREYVDVLYAVRHYFTSVSKLLQSAVFHKPLNDLNARLADHHLTEDHANKLMAFLKTGSSDAYASEASVFLNILNGSAKEGSPFQLKSIMKDEHGRCTPFALMAMKSLSMNQFVLYVKKLASLEPDKVILTAFHRDVLYQGLDQLRQEGGMEEVVELLASFRLFGFKMDAEEPLGRDILMGFFPERLRQEDTFHRLLAVLNVNLDTCFNIYQGSAPEKRLGPVDEPYIAFLSGKLAWSGDAIFHHLTLEEKRGLPVMLYFKLARAAGLDYPDIRDTFTEKQSEYFLQVVSQTIKNSSSLLETRENLLSSHRRGMDLGTLEYDLLNNLPNLDKETALLLFRSKALQAQYYSVRDGGACERQQDLSYHGLNRIIFTALLALDPEVYQQPADEGLDLTSFEEAFKYWMITLQFNHRVRASYEGAIFHDNFNPKAEIQPSDDDHIHYKRDPRGHAHPKLCTDKALEARVKAARADDTPEALARDTPVDHGQIATMLALKKIGLRYDRHGVKHGLQKILNTRPRLKNASCDHPLLCRDYFVGSSLLENILMSHQSNETLSEKTKEFKALQEARKKQPISPEGLPLLKEILNRSGVVLLKQAVIYIASSFEPSDEDVLSIVKKHLWVLHEPSYQRHIESAFDSLSTAQLELLKTRLVKCVLSDDAFKAQVSSVNKDYILLTILRLGRTSVGERILLNDDRRAYDLSRTHHWKALNVYLNPASPPALLTKFGKFAGVSADMASGDTSFLSMRYEKPKPGS